MEESVYSPFFNDIFFSLTFIQNIKGTFLFFSHVIQFPIESLSIKVLSKYEHNSNI